MAVLCLLPMLGHWLLSSPGQSDLRRDDLSLYRMVWRGREDGGMLLLSHLLCCKPVHALALVIPEVAILYVSQKLKKGGDGRKPRRD